MGIDLTGLRALAFAKRVYDFNFGNIVMLGRQEIHFWKEEYLAVQADATLDFEYDDSIELGRFSEPLFQKMGAQNITSIDASRFEGATLLHDFNRPVPDNLHGLFDTFVDFGSIEHVFNVMQAIDNVRTIVKLNGSILILTVANGFAGHGLYQYSPEFFYDMFNERNGFSDTSVFLIDASRPKMWHLIKSPARLKHRNRIPLSKQLWVAVFSRKRRQVNELEVFQSDYENIKWRTNDYAHFEPWNQICTLRSRRIARNLLNPYAYKAIAHINQTIRVLAGYRADRVLIDPDKVDPAVFKENIRSHCLELAAGAATAADRRDRQPIE